MCAIFCVQRACNGLKVDAMPGHAHCVLQPEGRALAKDSPPLSQNGHSDIRPIGMVVNLTTTMRSSRCGRETHEETDRGRGARILRSTVSARFRQPGRDRENRSGGMESIRFSSRVSIPPSSAYLGSDCRYTAIWQNCARSPDIATVTRRKSCRLNRRWMTRGANTRSSRYMKVKKSPSSWGCSVGCLFG